MRRPSIKLAAINVGAPTLQRHPTDATYDTPHIRLQMQSVARISSYCSRHPTTFGISWAWNTIHPSWDVSSSTMTVGPDMHNYSWHAVFDIETHL